MTTPPVRYSDCLDEVDWPRLAEVFKRAPLGERDPAMLKQVFSNSSVRCFAYDGATPIGAGRALTDGIRYTVIFDVVVLPEWQGRGIGKRIMAFLTERAGAANVLLHAAPGKEAFYERLGFRRMKTALARFADAEAQRKAGYVE